MSVSDTTAAGAPPSRAASAADPLVLAERIADRHLAVISSERSVREGIAHELAVRLAVRPATVVVHMADLAEPDGNGDHGLHGPGRDGPLVEVIADRTAAPGPDRPPRHRTAWQDLDDGRSSVLEQALATVALLARTAGPGWRILIWHDADEALAAAPHAFEQVLELLLATTVEHEYLQPGDLVLQRLILLGGPALAAAVADADGPFRRWSAGTREVATAHRGDDDDATALGLDPRILDVEHPRFEIVHA